MNLLLSFLLLFALALAIDLTPEQIKKYHDGQFTVRERAEINAKRKEHTMDKLIKMKASLGEKGFAEELEKRRAALKRLSEVTGANTQKISQQDQKTIEQMKKWSSGDSFASKGSITDINREVAAYLYEGDILLSSEKIDKLIAEQKSKPRAKRGAPDITATLWDKTKPIPYFFGSLLDSQNHTEQQRALIRNSIRQIEAQTCIRFEENDKPVNKVLVWNGDGCNSAVGVRGGTQTLSLFHYEGYGTCLLPGIIQHEFLHVLGIRHTQARYDRDSYVTVNTPNIDGDFSRNFNMLTSTQNNNFGVPYDYGSVMHYAWNDFAIDKTLPSLIPRSAEYTYSMGQRLTITYNDVKMVNELYKCKESCTTKIDCGVRGYQNPKNCSVCICNDFFRGDRCEIAKYDADWPYNFFRNISPGTKKEDWAIAEFKPISKKEETNPARFQQYQHDYSQYTKYYYKFTMKEPTGYGMNFELTIDNPAFQCTEGCYAGGITIIESDVEDDFSSEGKTFCCFQQNGHVVKTRSRFVGVKVIHAPGINSDFTVRGYPVTL